MNAMSYSVAVCEEAVNIKSLNTGREVVLPPEEVPSNILSDIMRQLKNPLKPNVKQSKPLSCIAANVEFGPYSDFLGWFANEANRTAVS